MTSCVTAREDMSVKTEISLDCFYVFNPALGFREGEEEKKLLYYYPKTTDLKTKIRNIGLSEAIFNFTKTFNPDQPCEVLDTQKTRHIYYNPEPNIHLVLVLRVPFSHTVDGDVDYHNDYIQNDIYSAVLKQMYKECRMFIKSFSSLPHEELVAELEAFYDKYLPCLRVQNCDILDLFQGIHFLPLDKITFLHIQSCLNLMLASFPMMKYSMFLCHEQLVWSGLDMEDTQLVFRYLVTSVLYPMIDSETVQSKEGSALPRISSATNNYGRCSHSLYQALALQLHQTRVPCLVRRDNVGRFLTGATSLDSVEMEAAPVIHLHYHKDKVESYHFVIYNALSTTLCLFIPASLPLSLDLYKKLDVFLSPKLTALSSEISSFTENSLPSLPDLKPKFVYFNQLNLAMKSCLHNNYRKSSRTLAVDSSVMRILMDIKSDHKYELSSTSETIVKTLNDYWVIGKLSNSREFYIVIQHKNANLIEITEEVKKICDSQLENIFFCQ